MYNGNDGYNRRPNYSRIGGFPIKPAYLYIAALVAIVLAVFLVMRFLNASLVMHYSAVAGVLLVLANLRELIGQSYTQRGSTALLNMLIGGGLICAWLSQLLGVLFWIPALIMIMIAAPLTFGRARVYTAYLDTAKTLASTVKRTLVH